MKRVNFIKDSLIYWLGRMGSKTVSFLLLPIYTAYIIPADWGILHLLMISGDLAFMMVSFEIPSALYRFWALAKTEEEKKRLAGLGLVFPTILSCLLFLPIYIWADNVARIMGIAGHGSFIRILLFTEQLAVILNIFQAEMRLRNEAKLYASLDIAQNFGSAALNIFFVVVCGWGIWGILLGTMLTFLTIVASLMPRFKRRTTLNFDIQLLKKLLLFSLPLVPSTLAMAAVHNIDRYFIQFMLGPTDVGIYSMGYKFGTLVRILVLGPFLLIWLPKSYELAVQKDAPAKFGKVFTYLLALLLFMVVGISGAAQEIVQVLTAEKYHLAYHVIPVVAFSYLLFGIDSVIRVGLLIHKRTNIIMFIVLAACAINIFGNWILIPRMGMIGAAWSTLVTFGVLTTLDGFFSRKYLKITYEWKKLALLLGTATFVLLLMIQIDVTSIPLSIALKGSILCLFPVILFFSGFITKESILTLKDTLTKK